MGCPLQCYKRVERVLGECEAAWREAVGRAVHASLNSLVRFALCHLLY
jgi:hypothetical protein